MNAALGGRRKKNSANVNTFFIGSRRLTNIKIINNILAQLALNIDLKVTVT